MIDEDKLNALELLGENEYLHKEIERLNKRINELEDRLQIIRNNECEKLTMKAARLGIPSSQLLYKSQELKEKIKSENDEKIHTFICSKV